MKKILLPLLLILVSSCFASERNANNIRQSHSNLVDTKISLEIENISTLSPKYHGCMDSADDILKDALKFWHAIRDNKNQPSLFIINFGGDYITGIYFVILRQHGKPYAYFPDEGKVRLPENIFTNVMNLAKTSKPNTLSLDKYKNTPSQHVECRFAVYVEGNKSKIFRALSDNNGIDSFVIKKLNKPIFRIINDSDEK